MLKACSAVPYFGNQGNLKLQGHFALLKAETTANMYFTTATIYVTCLKFKRFIRDYFTFNN